MLHCLLLLLLLRDQARKPRTVGPRLDVIHVQDGNDALAVAAGIISRRGTFFLGRRHLLQQSPDASLDAPTRHRQVPMVLAKGQGARLQRAGLIMS